MDARPSADGDPTHEPPRGLRPARRGLRRGLTACAALVILWLGWSAVDLGRAAIDARAGQHALLAIQPAALDTPGGIQQQVTSATGRLRRADRIMRTSPPLRIARHVPLVGPQIRTIADLTHVGAGLGNAADVAAAAIQAQLNKGTGGAQNRLALLDVIAAQTADVRRALGRQHVPRRPWTVAPLAAKRDAASDTLSKTSVAADEASNILGSMQVVLNGPSKYLVLAGNNAEMRATGMVLSAGLADVSQGQIKLEPFRQAAELYIPPPDQVAVSPELKNLYGWMSIGGEWRAGTATPNFPAIAPVYAEMAKRKGLGEVRGVVFVDVVALQAILAATGPVEVDGVSYDAMTAGKLVMYDNYLKFGTADLATRAERSDVQSRLGSAAFQALNERKVSFGALYKYLKVAASGRHLMAWAKDDAEELLWQRVGVDGALDADEVFINLQNISASKLDYHITPEVSFRSLSVKDGKRVVRMQITISNQARNPTSEVIEGALYGRENDIPFGWYRQYLMVYLPYDARTIRSTDPPFSQSGADGPNTVAGFQFITATNATRVLTIDFTVSAADPIRLAPLGRAFPVKVHTPKGVQNDREAREIRF